MHTRRSSETGCLPANLADVAGPTMSVMCQGTPYGPTAPTDAQAWAAALPEIATARLATPARALLTGSGVSVDRAVLADLQNHAFDESVSTDEMKKRGAAGLRALSEAGVPFLVFKGAALARYYRGVGPRPYSDIDLLVAPQHFGRALATLAGAGYSEPEATRPPWPFFGRFCREGVNLVSPDGGAIDVHHHASPWTLGARISMATLLPRAETVTIADLPVQVPGATDCLVFAVLHVVNDFYKGGRSLQTWRDVFLLFQATVESDRRDTFATYRLEWLYDVVAACVTEVGGPASRDGATPPQGPGTLSLRDLPLLNRTLLHALGWTGTSALPRHPLGWAVRLPPLHSLAFVVGSIVPSPSYARDKHGGYRRYWSESAATLWASVRGADYRVTPLGVKARADQP